MESAIDIAALRTSVAEVLARECGRAAVIHHAAQGNGPMRALWTLAGQLGWTGLSVPEANGGMGLGLDALVPIYEEMGRVAAPLPFLTTMLAADALARSGQQAEWLARIAGGAIATLSAPVAVAAPTLAARYDGDEIVLTGVAADLLDARDADFVVVLARGEHGALLRVVIAAADAVPMATKTLWDHGHTLSTLAFDGLRLPASRAFAVSAASEQALLTHAAVGLAAEAIGGSEGVLALTIDYLQTREQFGKPIGSFQALKHRVADHRTRMVAGRALLESAVRAATSDDQAAAREASSAKALACADFVEVARDAIQLHGGMGFTEELPCHLYLKRAHLNAMLFGDQSQHLRRATPHLFATGLAQ
jgi:alkylation response protein AidB-like acyl-CoA dehydrogenase